MFDKGFYQRPDFIEEDAVNLDGQVDRIENPYSLDSGLAPIPPHIHGHLHGLEFFI